MAAAADTGPIDQTHAYAAEIEEAAQRQVQRFRKMASGVTPRSCPLCGYHGMFTAFGNPPRIDVRCPKCNSLERHRLFYLFAEKFDFIRPSHIVLHFAPEKQIGEYVTEMCGAYETADLSTRRKMTHHINAEDTGLPDDRYDRILFSHVLEHVDDRKTLNELFRILKPGGKLVLMFPIIEAWRRTYENADVETPEDRVLHFGQADHVRMYGRDVRGRIKQAGFELAEYCSVEPEVRQYGLMRGETVFVATKPEAAA